CPQHSSLKILNASLKYPLVLVSGHIDANICPHSFGMAQFAEYTSIRACYAFNCIQRSGRVESYVIRCFAFHIYILRSYLPVGCQCPDRFFRCNEPALTMRYCNSVDITDTDFAEPG